MFRNTKKILTIAIIINTLCLVSGQELRSIRYNPAIAAGISENSTRGFSKTASAFLDTLTLDFLDDFSNYGNQAFPSPSKWSDSYAYINSTFADSMISIGVATLDAYDKQGLPYPTNGSNSVPSDTLTSQTFKFESLPSGPVYLSFFYQAGGKGDMPETNDSLVAELYSVSYDKWIMIWSQRGGELQHTFTQVILPVNDSLLVAGFRFRFRNYTSIKQNEIEKQSNADQWNLDYIQLKASPDINSMKNLNDVMIIEPLLPSLNVYSSVPYRHFLWAQGELQRTTIPFTFRTYFPVLETSIAVDRIYNSKDLATGITINTDIRENYEPPYSILHWDDFFSTGLSYRPSDTIGKLELKCYISTSKDPTINKYNDNDTITRNEYYYDYYAYDDGSAEFGFGISGESQDTVQIAYRYKIYRNSANADTLRGIFIYFNKTTDLITDDIEFKLCVWKSKNGKPGDIMYQSSQLHTPELYNSINRFARIDLEYPIAVYDTIFIGIKQPYTAFINIGYDINYNSRQHIFVKTDANDWYNPVSIDPGSLMMRPSFGKYDVTLAAKTLLREKEISLYPNPANNLLHFKLPEEYFGYEFQIQVLDIMGRVVMISSGTDNTIDISSISKGVYLLVIYSTNNNYRNIIKFIKE